MPIIPIIRSGGPKPSGKITITENGTGIDVAAYAEADVAVPITSWQGNVTVVNNTGRNVTVYVAKEGQNLIDETLIHDSESVRISMPCNSYTYSGHTYLHVGGVFYVKRSSYSTASTTPKLKVTASGSPLAYDPVMITKANGQYTDYIADVIMIKELTTTNNYKSVTYTLSEETTT